jgi:hypothetical protein
VPQSLSRRGRLEAADFVVDVSVTLLPLLFLTFAVISATPDRKKKKKTHGRKMLWPN